VSCQQGRLAGDASTAKHQNQTSDPSAKWPQANLFCKSEILQNLEVILTLTLSAPTITTPSAQGSWKLYLARTRLDSLSAERSVPLCLWLVARSKKNWEL